MHPAFQTLLVLQDRDAHLDRLQKELDELPRLKQRELDKLAEDEAASSTLTEQLQDNHKQCKRLELDTQTRKDTLERLRSQQYETKKNAEFTALGHEIENYQTQISGLEDQELALWEAAEELEGKLAVAEETLGNHRRGIDSDIAQLEKRVDNLAERRREFVAERHVLASELDESLFTRYEGIRRRKPDPVAEVIGGTCKGCHMKIPRGTEISAGHDDELVECPNCGRFIYGTE